jgi:hypothetical protein
VFDQSGAKFPCAGKALSQTAQLKSSSRTTLRSPHVGQRRKMTVSVNVPVGAFPVH